MDSRLPRDPSARGGGAALPPGRIKDRPEDFRVDEIPLYEPSGVGDHLYVRFEKRDRTTDDVVRALAGALGAPLRDVGVPGMKDKVAITTQTVSLPVPRHADEGAPIEPRARALVIPGVTILDARRHANKLRTGHLAGNRFRIVVRDVPASRAGEVLATFERIGRDGLPNAFGGQRFGRDGDNADRARAWLTGKAPVPRDPRQRRFLWSSLQSAVFNELLARRVALGTWSTPLLGDLLKKRDSGGLFVCSDLETDRARARAGEVGPTGPIVGVSMREPEGEARDLERTVTRELLGEDFDWSRTKALGEGARRPLRLWVDELTVSRIPAAPDDAEGTGQERDEQRDEEEARARPEAGRDAGVGRQLGRDAVNIVVGFVLAKGAYATTVLSSALTLGPREGERAAPDAVSVEERTIESTTEG